MLKSESDSLKFPFSKQNLKWRRVAVIVINLIFKCKISTQGNMCMTLRPLQKLISKGRHDRYKISNFNLQFQNFNWWRMA